MIDALRQLARHSAVYGVGSVLPRLLALLLVPLYTRELSMAEYGVLSLLVVAQSVTMLVAQLGLGPALFREVLYEGTDERRVLGTAALSLGASSLVVVGGLVAAAAPLARWGLGGVEHAPALRLALVASGLSFLQPLATAHLRLRQRSTAYSVLAVGQFVVLGALSVWFVAVRHAGLVGLMTANVVAAGLFAVVYLVLLAPHLRPVVDGAALTRMLRMGRPLVVMNLAALVMTAADRVFIKRAGLDDDLGRYVLGYSLALGMNLAVQAVQLAWPAQLYPLARRPDGPRVLARLTTVYAVAMGYLGLAIAVLAPEAVALLAPPRYAPAAAIVPLVVAAYLLYGLRFMTNAALEVRNELGRVVPIILGAAALNLALNAWWIPAFGIVGAAWATLVSYAVLFAAQTAVNLRLMPIPYETRHLAAVAATWAALAWAGARLAAAPPPPATALALKAGLLAAYPALLSAAGVVDARQRARARRWLGAHLGRRAASGGA